MCMMVGCVKMVGIHSSLYLCKGVHVVSLFLSSMPFQTWSATQLYVHFGVYFLYPLHTPITGLKCTYIHDIQLSFSICIELRSIQTYSVPKLSKLGTKTLFVSSQTIVCAFWSTWFYIVSSSTQFAIQNVCSVLCMWKNLCPMLTTYSFVWCCQWAKDHLSWSRETRANAYIVYQQSKALGLCGRHNMHCNKFFISIFILLVSFPPLHVDMLALSLYWICCQNSLWRKVLLQALHLSHTTL